MYLVDGYSTILNVTFPTANVTLFLIEREVQPPSLEVGSIDTSNMRNKYFRTKAAKQLVELGEMTLTCAYDPQIYAQMLTVVPDVRGQGNPPPGRVRGTRLRMGQNAQFQVVFPDAHSLVFSGHIDKITPSSHKEGEFPTMELKVVPTHAFTSQSTIVGVFGLTTLGTSPYETQVGVLSPNGIVLAGGPPL